jgi:hypothetical protein
MNYQISNLCPRTDISLGCWGFSILLFPRFKEIILTSEIDDCMVSNAIENMGRFWLDGCGYNSPFSHDGVVESLYEPRSIRVSWGEWGPEHISVPGNACSLDLNDGLGKPPGGRILVPHNIDSMSQAMLLIMVFTWFAEKAFFHAEGNTKN